MCRSILLNGVHRTASAVGKATRNDCNIESGKRRHTECACYFLPRTTYDAQNMPHMHRLGAIWFAISAPLITACGRADQLAQAHAAPAISAARQTVEEPVQAAATVDQDFAGRLQHVANDYLSYALIDRLGHWAPELCLWSPTPQFSEAAPEAPHAQKIYFLYVKDPDSYEAPEATQPVGQAIVKQSWAPEEVSARATADADGGDDETSRLVIPYASRDGKRYRGNHQTGLFVMLKLDPETRETDEGWIYGTVTPDGKNVLSAGRVESCMECHQQAKGDRVFGIKRDDSRESSPDN